ncbi:MAG: TlpA family protein disulfide reductase [Flavobacteriales bacterium]|nr:TlpA family protein disulfide reductase [Flavobacteriales bacterium]
MTFRRSIPLLVLAIGFARCTNDMPDTDPGLRAGPWHMELDLHGHDLPFQFELVKADDATWDAHIHNGAENIWVTVVEVRGDTFQLRMPLFDSEFVGTVQNDSTITGDWVNHLRGPDYRIPFLARAGNHPRFRSNEPEGPDLSGTWEAHFSTGTADAYHATGILEQDGTGRATGTFLTETGDYRYLEGVVYRDSLKLSCFDGSHAFLFHASIEQDSLHGRFWSGTHWTEPWVAFRNPDHRLRHPDSLTFLQEGYDMVDFTFPDLDGRLVSPSDAPYQGKPLVVQVMGSWCPNCVDESRLLNEVYARHHEQGLELISIAFEQHADTIRAIDGLKRYRDALGLRHTILYGGMSGKGRASAQLPFLNHLMSFPTSIFVDRKGKVRRIHTGFYGPGTGRYYDAYKSDLYAFVQQLLNEPAGTLVADR